MDAHVHSAKSRLHFKKGLFLKTCITCIHIHVHTDIHAFGSFPYRIHATTKSVFKMESERVKPDYAVCSQGVKQRKKKRWLNTALWRDSAGVPGCIYDCTGRWLSVGGTDYSNGAAPLAVESSGRHVTTEPDSTESSRPPETPAGDSSPQVSREFPRLVRPEHHLHHLRAPPHSADSSDSPIRAIDDERSPNDRNFHAHAALPTCATSPIRRSVVCLPLPPIPFSLFARMRARAHTHALRKISTDPKQIENRSWNLCGP